MDEDVLNAGFQAQFLDYLSQYEIPMDFTALEAVKALNQVWFVIFFHVWLIILCVPKIGAFIAEVSIRKFLSAC